MLRLEIARAALANVVAWLGWLPAMELFRSLCWCDITVNTPADGPVLDLPVNVGALQFRLLKQTKTDRTRTADLILAYSTILGLRPGLWVSRLQGLLGLAYGGTCRSEDLVFQHHNGKPWDSRYFREQYLIPSLQAQRLASDAALRPYDGSPSNTLAEKFWSMHSFRQDGCSHVSQKCARCLCKVSPDEVFEHGWWQVKRESMTMPQAYNEWSPIDRLAISQLCM